MPASVNDKLSQVEGDVADILPSFTITFHKYVLDMEPFPGPQ